MNTEKGISPPLKFLLWVPSVPGVQDQVSVQKAALEKWQQAEYFPLWASLPALAWHRVTLKWLLIMPADSLHLLADPRGSLWIAMSGQCLPYSLRLLSSPQKGRISGDIIFTWMSVGVCTYSCMCMYICVRVQARGQCWVFYSIALYLPLWDSVSHHIWMSPI